MSIVRFTQVNSGYSFEIETVSENTIVVGENSTDVCKKLAAGIDVGTITVDAGVTFWIQKPEGLKLSDIKCIVITNCCFNDVGENLQNQVIIRYSREEAGGLAIPLDSIWVLRENAVWYQCKKADGLCIAEKSFDWEVVVTKDTLDKGTRNLLKDLHHNATTIYPMDHTCLLSLIEDTVRSYAGRKILILIDMFDVGKIYQILTSIQMKNPNIRFYDYAYFGGSP